MFGARAMRLLGWSRRESAQAELELVRLGALNASVQTALQEASKTGHEESIRDDDLCKQFGPVDSHVNIDAQLKELKVSLGKGDRTGRGPEQGGGQYCPPPFPSGPDDSSRVPRRPVPTVGDGEIALALPETDTKPES